MEFFRLPGVSDSRVHFPDLAGDRGRSQLLQVSG